MAVPLSVTSLQRVHAARELVLQAKRELQNERDLAQAGGDWYRDLVGALDAVDHVDELLFALRERARTGLPDHEG
jgi:hypothetical protein